MGHIDADSVRDLRLSASTRIQRANWVNVLRVLVLIAIDLLLLRLSVRVIDSLSQLSLLPTFDQLQAGNVLFELSTVALIAVGGGYAPGMSRRKYGAFIGTILLASLLSFAPASEALLPFDGWHDVGFLAALLTASLWKAGLLYGGRQLIARLVSLLRRRKIACYSVLIVAEPERQAAIQSQIESQDRYQVVAVEPSSCLDRGYRHQLLERIEQEAIDEIFIDWASIERRLFLLQHLRASKATVRILPVSSTAIDRLQCLEIDPLTQYTLPRESLFLPRFSIKRLFDVLLSGVAIALLSPFLLAVAAIIKLDSPGPVFYQQVRVGLKGQEFKLWKFRSMVVNAEQFQSQLESLNESEDGVLFKIRQDPRITPVGRFIRRYSIDELPQLFNVLCGQMSLVGPRPLPLRDVERFSRQSFLIRNEVLPGITGLWQVSGRSDIEDFEQAFQLDMNYIENWSLGLDLQIILKTFAVVLFSKGAY